MKDWLSKKVVEKTIEGELIRFRKVPVGTLRKFRCINKDLAKALGMVFKDKSHDVTVHQVATPSDAIGTDGETIMTTAFDQGAAENSTLSMRNLQMEEGIKALINAVTDDGAFDVLAEVVVKSAWEEFTEDDIPKIQDAMPTDTLVQFLQGAFEASAGDYAKLGKSLFQNNPQVQSVLEKMGTLKGK